MTTVVVDASVAVKWCLPAEREALVPQAEALLASYRSEQIRLLVPDLFWLEVANALWKAACRREISGRRCLVSDLTGTRPRYRHRSFIRSLARGFSIGHGSWSDGVRQLVCRLGHAVEKRTDHRRRASGQRFSRAPAGQVVGRILRVCSYSLCRPLKAIRSTAAPESFASELPRKSISFRYRWRFSRDGAGCTTPRPQPAPTPSLAADSLGRMIRTPECDGIQKKSETDRYERHERMLFEERQRAGERQLTEANQDNIRQQHSPGTPPAACEDRR